MSVTYYYDTANGLTSASTSTTSGMTLVTDQVMVVTSGSTVNAATLLVSSVDLTGSGAAAANPAGATLTYNGGFVVATVSGVTETLDAGTAIVQSGGAIVSSTIEFGGAIFVEGGVTSGTINSGGVELVFSGGLASGSVISAGTQGVYAGGTASISTIDAGAFQEIYSGGAAVSAGIDGQATQDVYSGGTASNSILYGGSTQTVHAGGEVYLNNQVGGNAYIYGVTSQSTVSSGGVENVMSGGSAQASWVSGGGTQIVSAGGVATGAYIVNIATQEIDAGGKATGTTVSGGTVNVLGGTLANSYLSTAGGQINVASGGVATGTVAAAGLIEIKAGGVTSGTSLIGGQEIVMNGGTANGTDVGKSGSEVVLAGGTATGTFLQAGGSVTVYDNGTVSGLLATGGVISLSGKAVTGDIVLSGSGIEVQFLGTSVAASSNVKISGLAAGDTIDLANVSGGASASYANGVLTVYNASGAVLATIDAGTPGGLFTVGTDTGTGTLITVVPNIETAAAAAANYQAGTLYSGVTVTDSAANIGANLNALESIYTAGKLTGVTLTDSGIAALSVTTVQLAADVNVLNGITGSLVVSVDASSTANAAIVGLSNHATVVDFSGTASQYTITTTGSGTFTVAGSTIGTDTLNGVTALKFSDVTEIVATANHAGTVLSSLNIAELYSAALNRAPDVAGLSYYENLIKSSPTITGLTVAEYFLSSPEYTAAHSYAQTAAGDSQFVSDLYTNILHRTGSTAEIAYYTTIISQYTNGLTAGTTAYTQAELKAHAQVLEYFSASAEFLSDIQITAAHPASSSHWLLVV